MCHPFNVFALFDNKQNKSKRFKRTRDSKEKNRRWRSIIGKK